TDLATRDELHPILLHQCDRVASRLRRADLRATVAVLKIKYADFRLLTRRITLEAATSDGRVLGQAILRLLDRVPVADDDRSTRVRLCGVGVTGFEDRDAPRQLSFDQAERDRG